MLDYIIWNVQPEIFEGIRVRWYGLFFAIGFFVSYTILGKIFKKEGLSQKELDSFTFQTFILLLVGLRLGHCLFYEWSEYSQEPWRILYVWEGGLASHGGAIGLLFSFLLFTIKTKKSFIWIASRAAVVIPLTATMVRLGNLMNSEIYGIPTELSWAFVYVNDAVIKTTPEFITNIINHSGIVAADIQSHVVSMFANSADALQKGVPYTELRDILLSNKIISAHNVSALTKSFIDAKLITKNHPTQIYEALMYITTFGVLMKYYFGRMAKNKSVSSYLILGIAFLFIFTSRFIIEFIKNEQVDFEKGMQLNMGQLLSIPFILFGIFFIFMHYKEKQKQNN